MPDTLWEKRSFLLDSVPQIRPSPNGFFFFLYSALRQIFPLSLNSCRNYEPDYSDPSSPDYCDEVAYKFAFYLLCVTYCLLAISALCCCCCCCCCFASACATFRSTDK